MHAVTGSMALCTPGGGESGTWGEAECAFIPRGCTKSVDPNHSMQQLFHYNLVTWLFLFSKLVVIFKHYLKYSLISRRTVVQIRKQFFTVPSNPRSLCTKRWKSKHAENDQGNVNRVSITYVTRHAMVHAYLLQGTWLVLDQSNFTISYWGIIICSVSSYL